jgi:hypothetical protein
VRTSIDFYGPEIEGKLLGLKIGCGASDLTFFSESFARRFQNTKTETWSTVHF